VVGVGVRLCCGSSLLVWAIIFDVSLKETLVQPYHKLEMPSLMGTWLCTRSRHLVRWIRIATEIIGTMLGMVFTYKVPGSFFLAFGII